MGLKDEHMRIEDSALTALIQGYCREASSRRDANQSVWRGAATSRLQSAALAMAP